MNRYYIVFCMVGNRIGDYFTGENVKQAYKNAFSAFRKYTKEIGINPYIIGIEISKAINWDPDF